MASRKILVDYNFNQNEIQNPVFQNLASAPSAPKAGQPYFNTSTHTLMVYDGTAWQDALSQGDYTFQNGIEIVSGTRNVQIKLGTSSNVTLTANSSGLSASVADASTSAKGVIEIATDAECTTGTSEVLAVNPKQLATKVTANNAITAGTATKITYDAKGLVTAGTTLSASDIPDISSTYVAKTLIGAVNGVAGLGSDGKVPTAQLPSFVDDVVDAYIVSGATALSAGWLSATSGGSALTPETGKIYVVLTTGEYLNKTYRWSGTTYVEISSSPGQATESAAGIAAIATQAECTTGTNDTKFVTPLKMATYTSGMVKTTATQTLTNKTIDADDNTIQDLTTSNFKSGTIVTTVGSTGTDTSLPTEKAVRAAIQDVVTVMPKYQIANNPSLTASSGVCTWTVTHTTGLEAVCCSVREYSTGNEVECDVTYGIGSTTIKINSSSNIAANTYKAYFLVVE